MEYVFGTCKRHGIEYDGLKTVGSEHSDLVGKHMVERTYPDNIITDVFDVVEKYHSATDEEGRCYDWYAIANHYRYMDKFTPGKKQIDEDISEMQSALVEVDEDRLQAESDSENALIELDEAIEQRLTDIENALCELTKKQ